MMRMTTNEALDEGGAGEGSATRGGKAAGTEEIGMTGAAQFPSLSGPVPMKAEVVLPHSCPAPCPGQGSRLLS
jgi:hypothetical protein